MALWTLAEVCAAVGVAVPVGADGALAIDGVSIDSRTVGKGELFVALKGTPGGGFISSFASAGDGHDHVKSAVDKGAAAVLVDHVIEGAEVPQIIVAETHMDGLWKLGAAARARFAGKVIGLTGSAGKSGTKEFLGAMLDAPRSSASYNNFWGVPLTLARLEARGTGHGDGYAVVEMGMNQPGEMGRLSELVKPDVALVVNVLPVHLEKIGSLAAIAREKLAVADGLVPGGVRVLPEALAPEMDAVRFAVDEGSAAEVCVGGWHVHGADWHVTMDIDGEVVGFMLREGAPHRLWNLAAACAAAHAAGFDDWDAAAERVAEVGVMVGRGTAEVVGGVTVIDDSFNGNPASVRAALESLKARPVSGRRFALLGEMVELGDEAPIYHAGLADACEGLDGVYLVGGMMTHLAGALPGSVLLGYWPDEKTFKVEDFVKTLQAGDAVVVKASKKIFYVHQVVKRLKTALMEQVK